MLKIGPYTLSSPVLLAPMAGITDLPFRQLCEAYGAGLTVSEMVTSDSGLWHTNKSAKRLQFDVEQGDSVRSVQLAGSEPSVLAEAAQKSQALGAQIIDINMGCPAKKVCKRAAGSALMKDPQLVEDILKSVVQAVDVPVTLKIRTGWSQELKNGVEVARIAENSGIAVLAVHGRTRACRFNGSAEYDTIAEIVQAVSIPVIANGDIDNAAKAVDVMSYTNAAGIMIGRGAQGKPWIFREINQLLNGAKLTPVTVSELRHTLLSHVEAIHQFYGDFSGVRIARKHIGWYLDGNQNYQAFRSHINQIFDPQEQIEALYGLFEKNSVIQECAA